MKRVRFPVIAAAAVVGALLVAVAVAFHPSFQTFAVRRALAAQSRFQATIGSVSAGLKRVEAREFRMEQPGLLLTVPLVEAEFPVLTAGLGKKVLVARLVARGWTLDLSRQAAPVPGIPAGSAVPAAASAAVVQSFSGLFGHFQLPIDVSVDGVELEGEVILPESRGRAKVHLRGGGLGAGREGKFDLAAEAALSDPAVNALQVRAGLAAAMDTPRSLTRLVVRLDAEASGARFPNGVKLAADLSAARAALGESYRAAIVAQDRQLLLVQADFPAHARRLDGTWKLDARDSDIVPFALGQPLPAFSVVGEGNLDTDAAFAAIHATGHLSATAERLEAIKPELAAIGPVRLNADFDVAQRGEVLSVERINASLATGQPVAQVQTLQAFEFNPRSGAVKAAEPARELLDVILQQVPLAWVAPFLKDLSISGGDLRGEIVATSRGGGMALRTKSPLTVTNVVANRGDQPLLKGVDFSVGASADYTPEGWQTEVTSLTAGSEHGLLVALEAKVGRLAGAGQPLKLTGTLSGNLPAWLAQPAASQVLALTSGDIAVEFAANLAAKKEVHAKMTLKNLGAAGPAGVEKLPVITADVRADIGPTGQVTVSSPLALERDGRRSDLTLTGTFTPGKDARKIDAQLVSAQLFVDDTKLLAAMIPERGSTPEGRTGGRDLVPAWAGLSGSIALHLAKVIYSDLFHVTNVEGTLRVDAGALKFEQFQAGLGEGGAAKLNGAVTFHGAEPKPYALNATLSVTEFDAGPVFQSFAPDRPATVEGRFSLDSALTGRALTLGGLAMGTTGEIQITSRGGVFRGIPVSMADKLETAGGLAAKLGNLANAISGKNDRSIETVANRAQAVEKIVNTWKAIPYDQLSLTLSRDANLNSLMKDFTLISPEVRLAGTGQAVHRAGTSVLEDSLAMEFTMRARGHHADLLKYLGALDDAPDELGYFTSTLPLKVSGTLGKPDTSELNGHLAAIALDKGGVSDRAMELFNRLRGGK